jgi:dTDP-4-amino-4,6-dideoxygalactose transaminase
MTIPFNRPHITGKEASYLKEVLETRALSGNGPFTRRCQHWLEKRFRFRQVLLTSSCTAALEMAALLLNIREGDEVIMPSYGFPSTANAFLLRGAKVVFADSRSDHPGMDEQRIKELITPRTKAIVVMHYAGVATDMDVIMEIAERHGLMVVEDAAQAIDAYYKRMPLGGFGHLGAYSFHATKNIQCGEGGALMVNTASLSALAELLREHGTDRAAFFRGEVASYNWVSVGSSFLPSELNAAFLLAQLEAMDHVRNERMALWNTYAKGLSHLFATGKTVAPGIPDYAVHNGHMFYMVCESMEVRDALIAALSAEGIQAVFHYQALHASPYYAQRHDGRALPNADRYGSCLLRLPLYVGMRQEDVLRVCDAIGVFFGR